MNIAAALILLGACGSASRTIVVEPSIERIVAKVILGGVNDVIGKRETRKTTGEQRDYSQLISAVRSISLRIDGRERTGVLACVAAACRVARYAIDRTEDREQSASVRGGTGSVEYSYRLRIRGLDVLRSTRIEDGRVSFVTDVYGSIGPRGELYHVRLVLDAQERIGGTVIVGTATGWSEIGRRCRVVAAIASRQIRLAMDRELLGRIQAGGIDLYRAGSIVDALR